MDIAKIRSLPRTTVEQALVIEQACKDALVLRPETKAEHAELLFLCAGAIALTQERREEAAPLAYRAYQLAYEAKDFVLAMQARCLHVYCLARFAMLGWFWEQTAILRRRVRESWVKDLRLPKDVIDACMNEITKLEEYGDRLSAERSGRMIAC